jgi:hypothetical protein
MAFNGRTFTSNSDAVVQESKSIKRHLVASSSERFTDK